MSHRWAALLLVILCLAMFLPGFASLPPMDRDEPRFAQASKQMLETGDFVGIRYQGEARNKKPVGIYWLQAATVAAGQALGVPDARHAIWLYRLPSLAGAIVAVLGTYWTALALTSQPAAFAAAVLLASTILINVEARLAKTDAVLLATVVLAMGALARVYRAWRDGKPAERSLATPLVFWTALAAGVLIKGPIAPMVPAFTVAVLAVKDRSIRWARALRPGLGLLWLLLLVLPWFVMILVRTQGTFLADSVGHDMLGKVAGVQEAHGAPPGTYLAAFLVTGWPLAPFVALAIPAIWRRRREPVVAFLLAWIIPVWLLFEAVPTKLPHYVLPTYPALAILAAVALFEPVRVIAGKGVRFAFAAVLFSVLPVALAAVAIYGRGLLWTELSPVTFASAELVALLLLAIALWSAYRLATGRITAAVAGAVVSALVGYGFIIGHLLTPAVADRLALSGRLASAAYQALGPSCPNGTMASAGDHEPSLVFLTATDTLLTDGAGAAGFLKDGDCRAALVEHRAEAAFQAALGSDPNVRLATRVAGTAINGARPLDIGIYVRQRHAP